MSPSNSGNLTILQKKLLVEISVLNWSHILENLNKCSSYIFKESIHRLYIAKHKLPCDVVGDISDWLILYGRSDMELKDNQGKLGAIASNLDWC